MESVLTEAERIRRRELTRDSRAAAQLGLSLDEYRQQREAVIKDWCEFLHAEMDRTHALDPIAFYRKHWLVLKGARLPKPAVQAKQSRAKRSRRC